MENNRIKFINSNLDLDDDDIIYIKTIPGNHDDDDISYIKTISGKLDEDDIIYIKTIHGKPDDINATKTFHDEEHFTFENDVTKYSNPNTSHFAQKSLVNEPNWTEISECSKVLSEDIMTTPNVRCNLIFNKLFFISAILLNKFKCNVSATSFDISLSPFDGQSLIETYVIQSNRHYI